MFDKKWWTAVVAVLVPLFNHFLGLGLDSEEITLVIVPALVYIFSQSIVDGCEKIKK